MITTVKLNIDSRKILDNVVGKNNVKAKKFFANELRTVTDPFVPLREGYLKNSATIAIDGSFIQYNMPYARRLWFGDGFNFNGAPQRGSRWVERSWTVNKEQLLQSLEKAIAGGYV